MKTGDGKVSRGTRTPGPHSGMLKNDYGKCARGIRTEEDAENRETWREIVEVIKKTTE